MLIRFGPFVLDAGERRLRRGDEVVHLSPKAFDLLVYLLRERPMARSKSDIHRALWPNTFVSDGNVAVLVREIRAALGDEAARPTYVRTVHRFGYAFCGSAADAGATPLPQASPVLCWLVWGSRRFSLSTGRNIVGREASVDVCVDAAGVSRRHAAIDVAGDEACVEDLGSKNGTFLGDVRVTARTPLADGAELRIGLVSLVFRRAPNARSTQTLDFRGR